MCVGPAPRPLRFATPLTPLRNWFGDGRHGSVVINHNTTLPSTLDGDMVVRHYRDLTVNQGCTLTVANRCRGLLLYVDGDLRVDGSISMSQRGCVCNPTTIGVDANTPVAASDGNCVQLGGLVIRRRKAGSKAYHTSSTLFWGCGRAAVDSELHQAPVLGNGKTWAIARAGVAGGAALPGAGTGNPGGAQTLSAGGGGSGSCYGPDGSRRGGAATCFSGGTGSGGNSAGQLLRNVYGGPGVDGGDNATGVPAAGGGGNPGGEGFGGGGAGQAGSGGLLILMVRGDVNIGPYGSIVSHGAGGGSPGVPGGGSGGGVILLLYGGAYANEGTLGAYGGQAGDGSPWGLGAAAGGAGSVTVESIDP